MARGIPKGRLSSLPNREMQIETTAETASLGLTDTLADRILTQARDLPAGTAGRDDGERQLRKPGARANSDRHLELYSLRSMAHESALSSATSQQFVIESTPKLPTSPFEDNRLSIIPQRTENDSTLTMAEVTNQWIAETQPQLPSGTQLIVLNERWQYLNDRIQSITQEWTHRSSVCCHYLISLFKSTRCLLGDAWNPCFVSCNACDSLDDRRYHKHDQLIRHDHGAWRNCR